MSFKIAHCSDIHIRSLARHDEFRITFQEFIDDCRLQNVDAIFVGGDIFHTKTIGISPEYIDLLSWWMNEMAKIAKVHVILGNHDGNLVNSSRQDAVSPILSALDNPSIFLYKKSGVYPLSEQINLCVFSVFDENGWTNVQPESGKINIAAYHGPVVGSLTELNFEMNEGLKSSFFKDYDFTFLGDIHKRQHLEYRDGKPIMSYPGSMLQLTYAEEISHGYLLWNIKSVNDWTVEYRELKNHKPFVTIEWSEKDDIDSIITKAKELPTGSRFRIKTEIHVGYEKTQKIVNFLKNDLKSTEVVFKNDQINKQISQANKQNYNIKKAILRSEDTLLNMLKTYHKNVSDENIWADVKDLVRDCLDTMKGDDDSARNVKWSLKNFKFDNLFSYGADNFINFENMHGIVGIFGPNRSGKSSIVGALTYSLFNTTDRGPVKNLHICNTRKPFCYSKLLISIDGIDYIIERQITKKETKKNIVNAITSLNFFKVNPDESLQDLVGEQRTDTEKVIRKMIGNSEDFFMTSLSAQGEVDQFIKLGSTKRRQILTKFLDLDVFSKILDLSNKMANTTKAQLKLFPETDYLSQIKQKEDLIFSLEEKSKNSCLKSNELSIDLKLLNDKLINAKNNKVSNITLDDLNSLKNRQASLENKIVLVNEKINSNSTKLSKNKDKVLSIENVFAENNIDEIKSKVDNFKNVESSLKELNFLFDKEKTKLSHQEKSIKILDTVPCGDSFPTCRFIKDAYETKEKIDEQRNAVNKAKMSLVTLTDSFNLLKSENYEEKLDKLTKMKSLLSNILVENANVSSQLVNYDHEKNNLLLEKENLQQKIVDTENILSGEENIELKSTKDKIQLIEKQIKDLEKERLFFATEIGKTKSEIERLFSEKSSKDLLIKDLTSKEIVINAFNKKGIPAEIIKSQIPLINSEISNILSDIVNFTVELEADEETDSIEIYIKYDDSKRVIELASGMEKMISSLAIRVALINVSSLPKSDFFIIDEGFGSLDEMGVEYCNKLMSSLKRFFKTIFIISHVEGIKDSADSFIELSRASNDSYVYVDEII